MKRFVAVLSFLILVLLGLLFLLPPFILRTQPVEQLLTQRLETLSGGDLSYQEFKIQYFPRLSVHLNTVALKEKGGRYFDIKAKEMEVYFARIPLLFGKAEVVRLSMNGGEVVANIPAFGTVENFRVEDVSMQLGSLKEGGMATVDFSGSIGGIARAVSGTGNVSLDSFDRWAWDDFGFDMVFSFQDVALKGLRSSVRRWLNVDPVEGKWQAEYRIRKSSDAQIIRIDSKIIADDFVYRIAGENQALLSPPMDVAVRYDISWDPAKEILNMHQASVRLPVGLLEGSGKILLGTHEFEDFRVTASNVILESIPQYFINLKSAIPFNIGFSGQSSLEMALSGTWDHLYLHANWDLSQALLTYARFFSKPKDYPLNFAFDYLLRDGKILEGDFSVRFKDGTLKGTVTEVDLEGGHGQMNIITNKFQLAGWEKLVPPIHNYEIDGQAKVFANFKGNLQKLYEAKSMFNISLEDASVKAPGGGEIKNANLVMDFSPFSFELNKAALNVAGFPMDVQMTTFGNDEENTLRLRAKSEALQPAVVYEAFYDIVSPWLSPVFHENMQKAGDKIKFLFPAGEKATNLDFLLQKDSGKWKVSEFNLGAYEGLISLHAAWDPQPSGTLFQGDYNVQRLSLARYGKRGGRENTMMEGNLFLKGNLGGTLSEEDTANKSLTGAGALLITNGAFRTFDILGTVKKISDFSGMRTENEGQTLFHDLRAEFKIDDGKAGTENLLMLGEHFKTEAEGEFFLDGLLNFRLDVFLDSETLPAKSGGASQDGPSYVGPVPLLLSGPLLRPELKPDPSVVSSLLSRFWKKSPETSLDSFLSEDFFLER